MATKVEVLTRIERTFPDLIILAYLNYETVMTQVNDLLWPLFEMGDSPNQVAEAVTQAVYDLTSTEPAIFDQTKLVQESFAQWTVRPRN